MLSRLAERMYRLGRYVEHAENLTRLLDVNHRMSLELNLFSDLDVWSPMIAVTRAEKRFAETFEEVNEANVYQFLVLSEDNPHSVVSCIRAAREEARTMRERISEEMWRSLNEMYLTLRDIDDLTDLTPVGNSAFNARVQQFCNAFHGLTDNTMVRSESWNFLRLGRFIERAVMTCRILEVKHHLVPPRGSADQAASVDLHQWEALLRSVSGYEAYRRLFRARIVPPRVIDLLVTNPRFPRSVRYSLGQLHAALTNLANQSPVSRELSQSVERLINDLDEGVVGERILRRGLKPEMAAWEHQIRIGEALISQTFFDVLTVFAPDGRERTIAMQHPQQQQQQERR